jgi:C4-dicarboxylate-specific signal transduction histidine kinase
MLAAVILVFIYFRIYLKQKANNILENRIEKALQAQEQQQNIILHQSSLTMLGEISAGISQEIKVQLEHISLSTKTLVNATDRNNFDRTSIKYSVDAIFNGVDKINKLIEHVRIFSSHQKSALVEKFSVNEVIMDAISMVNVKMKDHNIETILSFSEALPVMTGNPYKLEQVIINVVNNAIDAFNTLAKTPKDGSGNKIRIVTGLADSCVIIEIVDNGVGMSQHEMKKIFKPFYSTKDAGEAAGLGLPVSLSMVNEMNGIINIESTAGIGTICKIKIPVNA